MTWQHSDPSNAMMPVDVVILSVPVQNQPSRANRLATLSRRVSMCVILALWRFPVRSAVFQDQDPELKGRKSPFLLLALVLPVVSSARL